MAVATAETNVTTDKGVVETPEIVKTPEIEPTEPVVEAPGSDDIWGNDSETDPTSTDAAPTEGADSDKPFEFKLPEGMELDQAAVERFSPLLRGLGADDAAAQSLVDAYIEMRTQESEAQVQAAETQRQTWLKEIKEDPQIGRGNFAQTQANIQRALKEYGGELKAAFKGADPKTGTQAGALYWFQTYPPLVRMMNKIGQDLAESTFRSSNSSSGERSDDDRFRDMFKNSPDMFKK